jgi:hypothetical protein
VDLDLSEFDGVPANIISLVEAVGIPDAPEQEDDVRELMERFAYGNCMTCGAKMGKDTAAIVNKRGVVGMYCGGPCLQDMGILGYLEEQHGDVIDRIRFRSDVEDADNPE